MWKDLSAPWKASFEQAWEAYCAGSIPIGAALADGLGNVIATGRSRQFEKESPAGTIAWSKLSHAELNTLLQVSEHDYPDIRGCTLYTTVEPCPLCFGALVMSHVRSLCFAARDGWAGSTNLLRANGYISSKNIKVSGPKERLETVAVLLHAEYFLRNTCTHNSAVTDAWEKDCPEGVRLAKQWFHNGTLEHARRQNSNISMVYDEVMRLYGKYSYKPSSSITGLPHSF